MIVTVEETRAFLSKGYYSPEIFSLLNYALDKFKQKRPDFEDCYTNVCWYWRGYRISHRSAELILRGCLDLPDGLVMKICVMNKSVAKRSHGFEKNDYSW